MFKAARRFALAVAVCAASLGLSASTWAASNAPVDVVELMSLSCPHCREAEADHAAIAAAAQATGGHLTAAPLPSVEGSYARERVYYAIRAYGPATEAAVRASLFKGSQDAGQTFSSILNVRTWLRQDLPNLQVNWDWVMKQAEAPATLEAIKRAVRLVAETHARDLPTYVFLQGGSVVDSLSPADVSDASKLRAAVVAKIKALSSAKGGNHD
jgi:hypothetical protein